MLQIPCPWCGPRDEAEFRYGGQANINHPEDPHSLDDQEWAEYLFVRDNPRGEFAERWVHTAGCRRWFNTVRDTATNEITPALLVTSWHAASIPRRRQAGYSAQLGEAASW